MQFLHGLRAALSDRRDRQLAHVGAPYTLDEQFSWSDLPKPIEQADAPQSSIEAIEDEVEAIIGGRTAAPAASRSPHSRRRSPRSISTIASSRRSLPSPAPIV